MKANVNRYKVEMKDQRREEEFDNWVGDYIFAHSKFEAKEIATDWMFENGFDPEDIEHIIFNITDTTPKLPNPTGYRTATSDYKKYRKEWSTNIMVDVVTGEVWCDVEESGWSRSYRSKAVLSMFSWLTNRGRHLSENPKMTEIKSIAAEMIQWAYQYR